MMMLLSPWIIILLSAPFCSAVRKLIVNGEDAVRGRYPYFVTLQKPGAVNSYGAGALIAPDIILTAGHTKPRERDHVMPHVGTFSFDDDADFEEFEIVEMVRHPEFLRKGDDEFIHDFTILKLNRLSDAPVVKINRNNQVPFEGQAIEVMGLGTLTADDDARPNVLQQATLNYISNDECRQQTDPERGITFNGRIEDSHLCTYTPPNNSRDACNFDSGGPLILPKYEKGHDLLVALVSWGLGCVDPTFSGVNSRVSSVSDWIDETVCRLSEAPPRDFCPHPPAPQKTHEQWIFASILLVGTILFALQRRKVFLKTISSPEQQELLASPAAELTNATMAFRMAATHETTD